MNQVNEKKSIPFTRTPFDALKIYALDLLLFCLLYYVVDTRTISISLSFDEPAFVHDYGTSISSKTDIVAMDSGL